MFLWLRAEPLLERMVTIVEARIKPQPLPKPDPIPSDMMQHAMAYPQAWAREQAVSRLRELYYELGSWDAVRNIWAAEFET